MTNKTTNQQQSESQSLANLEWLVSTPRQDDYSLVMTDGGGEQIQVIEISREEYIQLKLHLARMRQCTIPTKRQRAYTHSLELGVYIEEPIWDEVEPKQLEEMGLVTA